MDDNDEPDVLVGCIVFDEHKDFLDSFWKALQAQDFKKYKTVFIDCSTDKKVLAKLEKTEAGIIEGSASTKTRELMIDCRNKIVDILKKNKHTHLMFLDPDIILPGNAISRLLFHGKEIVTGAYLFNIKLGERYEVCPCLYGFA